jgi:ribosome-associated heat shock protein Hsp15
MGHDHVPRRDHRRDPGLTVTATMDQTRLDRWLWAVRITKTRTLATDLCAAGHAEVNGRPAKAATKVTVGDRVTVHAGGRRRDLEVVQVIEKRVGAPIAAACVIDHSPPPPDPEFVAPAVVRDRGAGRPTKRDRRQQDRYRGG